MTTYTTHRAATEAEILPRLVALGLDLEASNTNKIATILATENICQNDEGRYYADITREWDFEAHAKYLMAH